MNVYEHLLQYFVIGERPDGTMFWKVLAAAPEEVRVFARDAHGTDMLPDDWRYQCIVDALEWLSTNDDESYVYEFYNDVDVYTSDLIQWLGSHAYRPSYVDEARESGMVDGDDATIMQIIMAGQAVEREEIMHAVVEAAAEYAEKQGIENLDNIEGEEV